MNWTMVIYGISILAAALALNYSIRSRRSKTPAERGLLTSKLNMAMGVMLFGFAMILLIPADATLNIVVGILFLLLGLFNLYAGIRNYRLFKKA